MSFTPTRRTPWAWTVATWFGAGNLRPGPGTYGSVAAVVLWFIAAHFLYLPAGPRGFLALTLLALAIVTALGIPASTIVAREAATEDPGFVVVDEVAGQLLALAGLSPSILHAVLALVLFRLFDITKPWPIRRLEQLHGGLGIMLDDLAAGAIALLVAQLLVHLVPALT